MNENKKKLLMHSSLKQSLVMECVGKSARVLFVGKFYAFH